MLLEQQTAERLPAASAAVPVWRVQIVAGVVLLVFLLLRSPAPTFIYDAEQYFAGARAVLDGGSVFQAGGLELRGVLTCALYLPAALAVQLAGAGVSGWAVLAENSVLIVLIGVVLLPRVVGILRPATPTVVGATAIGTGVVLAGFAPYPLTDLWAGALLLAVVITLDQGTRRSLLLAGLAAGAAVNIRPAMLLPLVAVGVSALLVRRWSAAWCLPGVAVALLPQFLLNRWRGTLWWPIPERTGWLTHLQAHDAYLIVRYDTFVQPGARPTLFWCSPAMLHGLTGPLPSSPTSLAGAYLTHMPQSLVFTAQKVGAALHWPLSVPYLVPAPVVNGMYALLITGITVVGAVGIGRWIAFCRGPRSAGRVALPLVWGAVLVGLVTSATETRFALPLVAIGVAGCALLVADGVHVPGSARGRARVAATLVAVVITYAVGASGMQHPVWQQGATLQDTCSAG